MALEVRFTFGEVNLTLGDVRIHMPQSSLATQFPVLITGTSLQSSAKLTRPTASHLGAFVQGIHSRGLIGKYFRRIFRIKEIQ